jgi:N-acetyl-alpha-D-muramate 1-phosphate uridylyltransferase
MIFAAGLGTRLRPLTHERPKALIEVGDIAILEHVARRLIDAGADRLIINTHPFPDLIRDYVASRRGFGVDVLFSHEPDAPLDTGRGLRQAARLFRGDAPFFLHNCDVFTDVDLRALYRAHVGATDARIATLAVLPPSPERYLIFDDTGLCGFAPRGGGADVFARAPEGAVERADFMGIHVADPQLLDTLDEDTPPSIIMQYMRLSGAGRRVAAAPQPRAVWIDIGTHEKLAAARDAHTRRGQ